MAYFTNILITAALALFMFSCNTASKAYESGNYTQAVELAAKKLQKDPNNAALQNVLKKAYQYAVQKHEDEIRIFSSSSSDSKWERIYAQYAALQNLYTTIQQTPAVASVINATDYSSYVNTYKDKTADTYVERGRKWMDNGSKDAYRQAYAEFKNALRYKPGNIEIKQLANEAYDLAVIKVVILPIDSRRSNYRYSNNAYQLDNFEDDLFRSIAYNSNNNFIKFYKSWDARSSNIEPDELLEMQMGRIVIGQPYDQTFSRNVWKEVVVKEIVYKKDSVVKEYAKVYATINTTRRTLVSNAELFVTARNPNGRILWSDNIIGDHQWQVEFSTFTGDERALSQSDKALLSNGRQFNAPHPNEITGFLLREVQNKLTNRLRNYYQRYY